MATNGVEFWHVPAKNYDQMRLKMVLQKYDLFTCVRDPYDRIISEYYCKWGGPATKSDYPESFNRYIIARLETTLERLQGNYSVEGHYAPQHIYTVDAKGSKIVPMENVLRFESLSSDFDSLMLRYELPYRSNDLPKINISAQQKRFGITDLSPRAVKLIQRV
jgi:hypothetical protein